MNITKVCCQGCGADLDIDQSIRFVTCNYCHTRLEVVHDATTTHTRLLDRIDRTTERMANNLKVIELQNDLERLDREWHAGKEGLMVRDKYGRISEPSTTAPMIAGITATIFGICWIVMASVIGAPGIFPLFGLVFIGFAIFGTISSQKRATRFNEGLRRYESSRTKLISHLEKERGQRPISASEVHDA